MPLLQCGGFALHLEKTDVILVYIRHQNLLCQFCELNEVIAEIADEILFCGLILKCRLTDVIFVQTGVCIPVPGFRYFC